MASDRRFYNEILIEHNLHPFHKHTLSDPHLEHEGINPSCGDDIVLQLKLDENGIIEEGSFMGNGCAISQASADIMLDLIIGKKKDEALRLTKIFLNMIAGKATPEEIEELEEGGALQDISHMPARVKCAVLGWHTLEEMLKTGGETGEGHLEHCE